MDVSKFKHPNGKACSACISKRAMLTRSFWSAEAKADVYKRCAATRRKNNHHKTKQGMKAIRAELLAQRRQVVARDKAKAAKHSIDGLTFPNGATQDKREARISIFAIDNNLHFATDNEWRLFVLRALKSV